MLVRTGGEEEETREWISGFIDARRWTDKDTDIVEMSDAKKLAKVLDLKPECFVGSNGCVYVRLAEVVKYVTTICAARTTNRDLAKRLYALKFAREQVAARVDDDTAKCRYFRSEPGFDADA